MFKVRADQMKVFDDIALAEFEELAVDDVGGRKFPQRFDEVAALVDHANKGDRGER